MRTYKLVYLNEGFHLSREKDLIEAEEKLNRYIKEGWALQQMVSPADGGGALVAVLYRDF